MRKKILKTGALTVLIISFIVRLFPYNYYPVVSEESLKQPACCCNCGCCSMGKGCCCCGMQAKQQSAEDTGIPCYKDCACGGNTDIAVSGYSLYHALFPLPSSLVPLLPSQILALVSIHKANPYISDVITPPPES